MGAAPLNATSSSDSAEIRTEADRLLRAGLLALLRTYRDVHVVGSYQLHLMTWRDLDIHLVHDHADVRAFFSLGGEIAALLHPHRMHFRDESLAVAPGLPPGFYWGLYLGDERAGAGRSTSGRPIVRRSTWFAALPTTSRRD